MEGVALRMPIRLGSPKPLGHDHACPSEFRMFVWFVALKSHAGLDLRESADKNLPLGGVALRFVAN
jgi:hypothetical protein